MAQKVPAHLLPVCLLTQLRLMAHQEPPIRDRVGGEPPARTNSTGLHLAVHLAVEGLRCFRHYRGSPGCPGRDSEPSIGNDHSTGRSLLFR